MSRKRKTMVRLNKWTVRPYSKSLNKQVYVCLENTALRALKKLEDFLKSKRGKEAWPTQEERQVIWQQAIDSVIREADPSELTTLQGTKVWRKEL